MELLKLDFVGLVLPVFCVAVSQDALHLQVPIWSLEDCIRKSCFSATVHPKVRLGSRHVIGREAEFQMVVLDCAGIPRERQA